VTFRQSLQRLSRDEQRLIEERVRSLLKSAAVEEPPTPREAIIRCAKMVEGGEIDLDDFRESIIERGLRKLVEGLDFETVWRKVRGLFRYDDRVFYVDPNQHPHQQVHATFHEAYHAIDPAHKELSEIIHLDNDQTLAPWVKRKMEMEANLGASLIRFQLNRLQREARDFPVNMETIVYLAQRFDASIHSTLRRYVEDIDELCMMLVFDPEPRMTTSGEPYYILRYHLASTNFEERFNTNWPCFILPDHWIFKAINDALPNKPSLYEWFLTDFHDNDFACIAQCFHNRYHVLALIYPKRKTRSKASLLFRIGHNGATWNHKIVR
jgi:hypothetical protein